MRKMTHQEAVDEAAKYATPVDKVIKPSDVIDGAEHWREIPEDRITDEIHHSIDIIVSEINTHPELQAIVHDRAVTCYLNDMIRVPMSDLTFATKKAAVENGYWPAHICRGRCLELLYERFPTYQDCYTNDVDEGFRAVREGLAKGMQPISL